MANQPLENKIVKKYNPLNEMIAEEFNITEYRLFLAYLASINPKNESTKLTRIYFKEYSNAFSLSRPNKANYNALAISLGKRVLVTQSDYKNGKRVLPLFKEIQTGQDSDGNWFFEIEAHEKALPYLFNYKGNFTTYTLKSITEFTTKPQVILYEILKQHLFNNQNYAQYEIKVSELQERLGTEYAELREFKRNVLDRTRKIIASSDDSELEFSYETGEKSGAKTISLIFSIYRKNPVVIDVSDSKASKAPDAPVESADNEPNDKCVNAVSNEDAAIELYGGEENAELAGACGYEFSKHEMDQIILILTDMDIPLDDETIRLGGIHYAVHIAREKYLRRMYAKLNSEAEHTKIPNRAKYFIKMIENEMKAQH